MLSIVFLPSYTLEHKSVFKLCQEILPKTDKVLHETNIHLVRILDRAFDAAIEMEEFKKALKYGLRTLEPYRLVRVAYERFQLKSVKVWYRATQSASKAQSVFTQKQCNSWSD